VISQEIFYLVFLWSSFSIISYIIIVVIIIIIIAASKEKEKRIMDEELGYSESFHVFFLQTYLCLIHFSTNLRAE
jgi:hypothetical protein